jgi:type III secretory pathway component EscT
LVFFSFMCSPFLVSFSCIIFFLSGGLLSLLHSFLRSVLLMFSVFSVPYHSRFLLLLLLYFCIRYLTIFSVLSLPYAI